MYFGLKILIAAVSIWSCLFGTVGAQPITRDALLKKYPSFTAADFANPKELAISVKETGGTLIYSDCPEYVSEPGILYSDVVDGDIRLLYYHVSTAKRGLKIGTVIESLSKGTIVKLTKSVIAGPSSDYCDVGRNAQIQFFSAESKKEDLLYVSSNHGRLLVADKGEAILKKDDLIAGIYDFSAKDKIRVTIIAYADKEDPLKFIKTAERLKEEKELRQGTFPTVGRSVILKKKYRSSEDGVACVELGNNTTDYYCWGADADRKGEKIQNYGNYGIVYKIVLPNAERGRTHYFLEPLGGNYSGAIVAHHGIKGQEKSLYLTPGLQQECFGQKGEGEYADLGVYDNDEPVWFEFSPPGASNMPVRIVMVPEQ